MKEELDAKTQLLNSTSRELARAHEVMYGMEQQLAMRRIEDDGLDKLSVEVVNRPVKSASVATSSFGTATGNQAPGRDSVPASWPAEAGNAATLMKSMFRPANEGRQMEGSGELGSDLESLDGDKNAKDNEDAGTIESRLLETALAACLEKRDELQKKVDVIMNGVWASQEDGSEVRRDAHLVSATG